MGLYGRIHCSLNLLLEGKMIKLSTPFRFVVIIIIGLFASEVIVMGVIGTMEAMPYLRLSILDAALMILLATPFLYFFSLRPLLKVINEREAEIKQREQNELALRRSEEKFRALADWTYDWEIWQDPQGVIVYTSPSCERITGYHPEDFIAYPNLLIQIVHPTDRPFYEEHLEVIHNESVGPLIVEYRILSQDGSEHWIEHICRPLYGKENQYLGRRISNREITLRKRAEMDVKGREQKEKMLTQTIHTMQMDIARDLHDTVGQNISYLRMKLDHIVEKEFLTDPDIAQDIKRMSEVANESYDMIRGTLTVLQSEDATDLSRLFARYAAQIEERSTFKFDFASHGNPKPLSANQMRQLFYVFREILSNIEKHSNASHVSLDLTWEEKFMTFVIFDNGRGFDSADLHSGHYGLQFIRDRLESLNGSISIYSEVGSGADIIIQVPYESSTISPE